MEELPVEPDQRAFLGSCRAFQNLTGEVVDLVFERFHQSRFEPDEPLMRQGEAGDCLMILVEGTASARLVDSTSGDRRPIAEFEPGDVVGEMALLTREPRSADVVAKGEVRALVLDVDDFHEVASQHPEVGLVLTHLVAERLGESALDGMGGKRVHGYKIHRCIGRGGMAVVYEAEAIETGDRVALKMMNHRLIYEVGAMARFQREADLLLSLQHEHIARVFARFSAYKTNFIVMEFCDGPELSTLVRDHGPFPEDEARRIIGQLASALTYLHGEGVIHRDLKPSNVMSTLDGNLKLTDFGVALPPAAFDEYSSIEASLIGTPLYMAPEQISGTRANAQTDIYGLGCVAYELLTGEPAFRSKTFFDLVEEKRHFALPAAGALGPGVSAEMRELLSSCLAQEQAARTVDLAELTSWAGPIDPAYFGRSD